MKPGIPETGTVIRLEGEQAVVRMQGEGACEKCGLAAAGMCTGGLTQTLTVRNTEHARVGDTVRIGLSPRVQLRGFALAYVIPSLALFVGTVGGHYLGAAAGFPPMDIIAGIFSLVAGSFFSLRRLKRLDSSFSIEIVDVLAAPRNFFSPISAEETVSDHTFPRC